MFRPKTSNGLGNPFILTLALEVSIGSPLDTAASLLSLYFSLISFFIAFRIYRRSHLGQEGTNYRILHELFINSVPWGNSLSPQNLTNCFRVPFFVPLFYLSVFYIVGPTESKSNELLILTVIFIIVYPLGLSRLFASFPGSFTFGEGAVVMQGAIIFCYKLFLDLLYNLDDETSRTGSINITARWSLFISLAWISIASYRPRKFYLIGSFLIFGAYLPYLWLRLRRNLFLWILSDISQTSTLLLLSTWIICVSFAVIYVHFYVKKESNTIDRKVFHLLISYVFISGMFVNVALLYFASVIVLAVFLLLEFIRLHQIKPFGQLLDHYFGLFLDSKDSGPLVLTNIYLLVGLSFPLWLYNSENVLINASGVLAIGIGDSAASAFGSKFGQIPWSQESKKTVEGSLASVLAQTITVLAILRSGNGLWAGFIISTLNALVEAFTDQVDNLIIPLSAHALSVLLLANH